MICKVLNSQDKIVRVFSSYENALNYRNTYGNYSWTIKISSI